MKRDAILAALPSLSRASLEAVAAAANGLLGQHTPKAAEAANGPLAWLYEAMQAELGQRGPYSQFISSRTGKIFASTAPDLIKFVVQAFGTQKKISTLAIFRLLLNLIADDLKKRGVTITAHTLSLNLKRAKTVFEEAFPGYIDNKLGELILTHMKSGKNDE